MARGGREQGGTGRDGTGSGAPMRFAIGVPRCTREAPDEAFFSIAIYGIFLIMAALILPLILIPVIRLTGCADCSEIVEEVFKALAVFFLVLKLPAGGWRWGGALAFGFLFATSENFLYLNQIFQTGDLTAFGQRFLWTAPMHIVTTLLIFISTLKSKWWIFLGLAAAIILHLAFNGWALGR